MGNVRLGSEALVPLTSTHNRRWTGVAGLNQRLLSGAASRTDNGGMGREAEWALMAESGTSVFGLLRDKADADLGTPLGSV